jgi:hypothetical protein
MTGFNLPPGCSTRDIDEAAGVERPCAVCAKSVDNCVCQECSMCKEVGNPHCYKPASAADRKAHGLRLSREQVIGRSEARMARLHEMMTDEGQALDYIVNGGKFSPDLKDNPDPWR